MNKLTTYLAVLTAALMAPIAFGATLEVTGNSSAIQYFFYTDACTDSDTEFVTPPAYSALSFSATVSPLAGVAEASISGPAGNAYAYASASGTGFDSDDFIVNVPGSGGTYTLEVFKNGCGGYAFALLVAIY